MTNVTWFSDDIIELFTAYCRNLRKITLQGCLYAITRNGIESIARNCFRLRLLNITCSTLRERSTSDYNVDTNDTSEVQLLSKNWTFDNSLCSAIINNLSAKIQHFTFSGFDSISSHSIEHLMCFLKNTLCLLDLSRLKAVNDSVLKTLGDVCRNLETVKLNYCKDITDQGVIDLVHVVELEQLELCGCEHLTDKACEAVSKRGSKLIIIKFDSCKKITEVGLNSLAWGCKSLQQINLSRTGVKQLPFSIVSLEDLTHINVNNCDICHPDKETIEEGLSEIKNALIASSFTRRSRCFFLGPPSTGKWNIIMSLLEKNEPISEEEILDMPVAYWAPVSTISGESVR